MTEPGRAAEAAPPRADGEELRFRIATGELRKGMTTIGAPVGDQVGLLPIRKVVVAGRPLWQKWVPAELGEVAPDRYAVLEAEVRALSRLTATYPVGYPGCLSRLMGYDVDAAEPYVLLEPYRGEPLQQVIGHLGNADRAVVQQGVLQALALVARARVVHGAVDVSALRWDGQAVQLVDFHGGALSLEPADFAADVAAAGDVLRKVVLGLRADGDRRKDPPALTEILDRVFDPDPAARPTAAELLARLHGRELAVVAVDPEQKWKAARDAFEEASRRKRQKLGIAAAASRHPTPPGPPRPTPPTPAPRQVPTKALALVAVGIVLIVLVAVAIISGVGR